VKTINKYLSLGKEGKRRKTKK